MANLLFTHSSSNITERKMFRNVLPINDAGGGCSLYYQWVLIVAMLKN